MTYSEIKIGDIIEIKNNTGSYRLLIDSVTDEKATGQRWNKSKGCWSKSTGFAVFPETKNFNKI